jgi:CxxC motif-containing protein (DUF1111 family)
MKKVGCDNLPTAVLAAFMSWMVACGTGSDAVTGEPGTPLPGLSDAELARFHAGRALFEKVYSPEEGLGPLFNENQCSACHTEPASGGTTGFERVVKATRFEGPGACDALTHEGGENIRAQATPLLKAHGVEAESIPPSATEVGRFTTPFLFGLGLVEAIPDEIILAAEDPDDADGDGISGRAGQTPDGRLARFSRKAEQATIMEFIDTALRLEMGLTTPFETEEETINGAPVPSDTDPAPDPEADQRTLELLTDFVRFLVPPAPMEPRSEAHRDTVEAGRRLFDELGCPACHTPSMRTGPSEIPALGRKAVSLYSDLLLHNMGPELADVCGYSAAPDEIRTEMLMGLGHRDRFLHDGRAIDLGDAILAHGGEAERARDAFVRLSWSRQQYVLIFLRSL